MAEGDTETSSEVSEPIIAVPETAAAYDDMDLETQDPVQNPDQTRPDGGANSKRVRDDSEGENSGDASKKQKVDKSAEEERLEKVVEEAVEGSGEVEEEEEKSGPVNLGPMSFGSSVDMFDYFFKLIQYWPPNLNLNKYEHMVLLDLLKKGHPDLGQKIGVGIHAFQVRNHPMWKSRCFFLIRSDESVDDFSFRKCVDRILPLPEYMKAKSNVSKVLGGGGGARKGHGAKEGGGGGHGGKGGGGGRRGGRGRGRGGRWRN